MKWVNRFCCICGIAGKVRTLLIRDMPQRLCGRLGVGVVATVICLWRECFKGSVSKRRDLSLFVMKRYGSDLSFNAQSGTSKTPRR